MGDARAKRAIKYRMSQPLVAIGICMEKYHEPEFFSNFYSIRKVKGTPVIRVIEARTDQARNKIVREFLELPDEFERLLFLDSDQVFPPDIIGRLLTHHKLVVGGLYFHRQSPFQPHVYKWNYKHPTPEGDPTLTHISVSRGDRRLIQCDAIGTGALMVAREVFSDIIKEPWFQYGGQWDSEDITFCRKLAKAQVPIYCDLGCECGHISRFIVGRETYLQERERMMKESGGTADSDGRVAVVADGSEDGDEGEAEAQEECAEGGAEEGVLSV